MAVSLKKGENVSLSKTDPTLKNVLIGLGWDARASDGADFDLDASLFMVGENGKVAGDDWFIFYNQYFDHCVLLPSASGISKINCKPLLLTAE